MSVDHVTTAPDLLAAPPTPTATTSCSSSIHDDDSSVTLSDVVAPRHRQRPGHTHLSSRHRTTNTHPTRRRGDSDDRGGSSSGRTSLTCRSGDEDRSRRRAGDWARRCNTKTLLAQHDSPLPRSPAELMAYIVRQRDAMRAMQEDNVRLQAREVEVSALALRLQRHFAATQSQIERIKAHIHLQLAQPISDAEYARIESVDDSARDLLDTIKLGIYRQLGSWRSSQLTATRRVAELTASVEMVTEELADARRQLREVEARRETEQQTVQSQRAQLERADARAGELSAAVADLERRLREGQVHQEQFLTAKLMAQRKTEEVAALGVRLEEAEMNAERHRLNAECSEQKLDILKTEFYRMKLEYKERVHELEGALRASEEKLRTLADVELESELFITNLARSSEMGYGYGNRRECRNDVHSDNETTNATTNNNNNEDSNTSSVMCITEGAAVGGVNRRMPLESWQALPRSRKMAHALTVTRRCLQLENKVALLQHDVEFKEDQVHRLQIALEGAREALHKTNSPYVLVEQTLTRLGAENERLREQVRQGAAERAALTSQLRQCRRDLSVLCTHRRELLRMKKALRQLGVGDGDGRQADSAERGNTTADTDAEDEDVKSENGAEVPDRNNRAAGAHGRRCHDDDANEDGDEDMRDTPERTTHTQPEAPGEDAERRRESGTIGFTHHSAPNFAIPTRKADEDGVHTAARAGVGVGHRPKVRELQRKKRAESLSSSQLTNASVATALPAINIQS